MEVAAEEGEGEGRGEGEDAEEEAEEEGLSLSARGPHRDDCLGSAPSFPMWPATIAEAPICSLPHAPPSCFVRFLARSTRARETWREMDSTQVCPFDIDVISALQKLRSARCDDTAAQSQRRRRLGRRRPARRRRWCS